MFAYSVGSTFERNFKSLDDLTNVHGALQFCPETGGVSLIDDGNEAAESEQNKNVAAQDGSSVTETSVVERSCTWGGSRFVIDAESGKSLLHMTASLLLRDSQGRLSETSYCTVVLSRMRRGAGFMDEVALHLAKKLECCLLSLGEEDLEDLAEEFYWQEQRARTDGVLPEIDPGLEQPAMESQISMTRYFFASKTQRKTDPRIIQRGQDAYSALLDAIDKRSKSRMADLGRVDEAQDGLQVHTTGSLPASDNVSERDAGQRTPAILHIRLSPSIMDNFAHSKRLLARMRDAVVQHRKNGQNISLLISISHTEEDDCGNFPDPAQSWRMKECRCWLCTEDPGQPYHDRFRRMSALERKLRLPQHHAILLMPSAVPSEWPGPRRAMSVAQTSIRKIKRNLRSNSSDVKTDPLDLLYPTCDWSRFSDRVKAWDNSRSAWNALNVVAITLGLRVACQKNGILTTQDIQDILDSSLPAVSTDSSQESPEKGLIPEQASQQAQHEDLPEDPEPREPHDIMPIINPPKDCLEKTRVPCQYQILPTTTSIRLVKMDLLPDVKGPLPANPENGHEKIICSTVVVDLENAPNYFALSYTWGDPRTTYTDESDMFEPRYWDAPAFEIECDGQPVTLATNLYTALLNIRWMFSDDSLPRQAGPEYNLHGAHHLHIWIDALCINQDDTAEKSMQVPQMDRIYSQARATVMWLGGLDVFAFTGFTLMAMKMEALFNRLSEDAKLEDMGPPESIGGPLARNLALMSLCQAFDLTDPGAFERLGLAPIPHSELIGWYLFVSRAWFRRAWIVQEWALSPNCIFLCGTMVVRQEKLLAHMQRMLETKWLYQILDLARAYVASGDQIPDIGFGRVAMPLEERREGPRLFVAPWSKDDSVFFPTHTISTISELRSMMGNDDMLRYPAEVRSTLQQMTKVQMNLTPVSFAGTRASDPRDKIYAFTSFFKDEDGLPTYPPPDYTKTVARVYTEAACTMAKELGVRFLAFVSGKESSEYIPSWVPDFSCQVSPQFPTRSRIFSAATGLATPQMDMDGDVLRVTGCRIDGVVDAQEKPLGSHNLVDGFMELIQLLQHLPEVSVIASPPDKFSLRSQPSGMPPTEMPLFTWDQQMANDAYQATETTQQSRFEVLWRTLLKDQWSSDMANPKPGWLGDVGNTHPAPDWLADIYMTRLGGLLRLQMTRFLLHEVKGILEEVVSQSKLQPDDTFLSQCVAHFASNGDGLLSAVTRALQHDNRYFREGQTYNRDEEGKSVAMMITMIRMLSGRDPADTEHGVTPDSWGGALHLLENATAAQEAHEFEAFKGNLDFIFAPNSPFLPSRSSKELAVGGFVDIEKLFVTRGGRLGISPEGLQVEDEVWLIAGLHVPIVLAKEGDGRYKVRGCCYVHGIMHGEAVSGAKDIREISLV